MNNQLNYAPEGATHYCQPYYYRVHKQTVFKHENGQWTPSLFDAKTLLGEKDCEKVT